MIEAQFAASPGRPARPSPWPDCSALPGLFFASIVHPFPEERREVAAYLERLMQRPSVRRVLAEAKPYFEYFPYRDAMPERYLAGL